MNSLNLTDRHRRYIKRVESFDELVSTPLAQGINALCWERKLEGDYLEIINQLGPFDEITRLEVDDLNSLTLSPLGKIARDQLISDLEALRRCDLSPELNAIPAYPRDSEDALLSTDVYSYHVDSANILADTFLCSYTIASSEGLLNEDAIKQVGLPKIRAQLLAQYRGSDDLEFENYLKENFYDLHYEAKSGARPYQFGLGNLWRVATQCPDSQVLPCIHRAPNTDPNSPARLLLIS